MRYINTKNLFSTLFAVLLLHLPTGCTENNDLLTLATEGSSEQPNMSSTQNGMGSTTATENNAALLRGMLAGAGAEGWTEGDSIWIYTLQSMQHNSYLLSSGAGSPVGIFSRTSGTDNYVDSGTLYAVTSCKYLYGFYSMTGGRAQLSVTIPNRYAASEVGAPEGSSRMPVPYWGIASFGEDGSLECNFSSLTALLKIDISTLPPETKAVVLTTHSYTDLIGEGTPVDGEGEPLSGTFDAVLEEGAKLAANPIFYSFDTLRVNLGDNAKAYKDLYIPVVAGSYTALNVIAVTRDSKYPYEWEGQLLKAFRNDASFRVNTIVTCEQESTGIRTPKI